MRRWFAFHGMSIRSGDSLAQRIAMGGGLLTQNVTSKTNYLVIKTLDVKEDGKLRKAMDLIDKGEYIRIVLMEDLEKSLNAKGYTEDALKATKEMRV